jgi:hypothetical protein
MTEEAERQFHRDMVRGVERLKREIGYSAPRFMQLVAAHGGVGAARRLLSGPKASDGFTTLWEHRRLEMSVEAHIVLPWYQDLFTDEQLDIARDRLRGHGFEVDAFVRRAELDRPQWAAEQ